jgi:hypothetical protein
MVLGVLALAGCAAPGSGDGGGDAPVVTSPDDVAKDAEGAARCVPASPAAVEAVTSGLEGDATLRDAWIVRSRDYNRAYFLSGEVSGGAGGDQIATWAVTSPDPTGTLVFSVTEPAKRLSDFSDAGGSFSGTDDGVTESQECASTEGVR